MYQIYEDIKITKNYIEYEEDGKKVRHTNIPSLDEIRDQIISLEYMKYYKAIGGKKARDNKLENYKIPAMVHTYYYIFAKTGQIPTVQDVCDEYIKKYVNVFKNGFAALKKEYKPNGEDLVFNVKDLKGRICRAYNSWNREIDLLINLIENYGNEFNFYYSFYDDYKKGVDIVAYDKKGTRFEIATYFSSTSSKKYKEIKNNFRHNYINRQINLEAYFEGENANVIEFGDAKLYNNVAVKYIYSELKAA